MTANVGSIMHAQNTRQITTWLSPRPPQVLTLVLLLGTACGTPMEEDEPALPQDSDLPEPGDPVDTDKPDPVVPPKTDDPPPKTLKSGVYNVTFDGLERRFRLTVPESVSSDSPLIIALHGYGSNAIILQGYSGLDALAETQGAVVAYPQSTRDNFGYTCWNVGYCNNNDIDDVGFLRSIIEQVTSDQGLDDVIVTGMSNGGDMTYRMACEADDVVSMAAPITGCMMTWLKDTCAPTTPPPVVHIHGTSDGITLYDGDPTYTGGGYEGTEASIGHLAGLHGAASSDIDDTTYDDVIVTTWTTDDGWPAAKLFARQGGGHQWPTGAPNYELDTTEVIWTFYEDSVLDAP